MMRRQIALGLMLAGCFLTAGCMNVDFVREGLTGGVSRGFERAIGGVVQDLIETILARN